MMTTPPNDQQPPKIEFPCHEFPIKVIGAQDVDFRAEVISTLSTLGVTICETAIKTASSRNARFVSLTIFIIAESAGQLSELNTELRKLPAVKLVI